MLSRSIAVMLILLFNFKSNSQVHFGIKYGTATLPGAELGYTIKGTNLHLGAVAFPGYSIWLAEPGFYGGYLRKTFQKRTLVDFGYWSWGYRGLLFANVGVIPSVMVETFTLNGGCEFVTLPKQIGGCVGGGFELLWGPNGHIASPFEIGFGKMPNSFSSLSAHYYGDPKVTSLVFINFGIRAYLGQRD